MEIEKLVIVGAGGFGREMFCLVEALRAGGAPVAVAGFVDSDPALAGTRVCGAPVLGGDSWLAEHAGTHRAVCGVGMPRPRSRTVAALARHGVRFAALAHPRASLSDFVTLEEGALVCAGAVLTTQVTVGRFAQINANATIGHDVVIEEHGMIAPAATLSGYVRVGYGAMVGAGAVVLPGLSVGRGAIVGAGAVVTRDVPPNTIVAGNPARAVRSVEHAL